MDILSWLRTEIHCFASIPYQCRIPLQSVKLWRSRKIKHLSNMQQALDFQSGRLLIYCLPPWVDSWDSAMWRCPFCSSFASLAMRVAFVCWMSKWQLCSSLPSSYLVTYSLNTLPKLFQSLLRPSRRPRSLGQKTFPKCLPLIWNVSLNQSTFPEVSSKDLYLFNCFQYRFLPPLKVFTLWGRSMVQTDNHRQEIVTLNSPLNWPLDLGNIGNVRTLFISCNNHGKRLLLTLWIQAKDPVSP